MRVVTRGERPPVPLSSEPHGLPMPLVAALDATSPAGAAYPAIERVGPDAYLLPVLTDEAEPTGHALRAPNPGPRAYWRDAELVVTTWRGEEVHVVTASSLAQLLVAMGWTVTPPDGSVVLQWENPAGLPTRGMR